MADSSKRYANPPKVPKKKGGDGSLRQHEGKAESAADTAEHKEGAGKGPTDKKPGAVGKVGDDPGPEGSPSPEFGVIADRHKSEHAGAVKRHGEEAAAMHERHGKELKDMHSRHSKELQDHMESAAKGKEDATAGSPEELGKEKSEGRQGSEP